MMTSSFLVQFLLAQSIQVTLIAALVWVATQILRNRNPHLAHTLWLLVLIKCVTPPIWNYQMSLADVAPSMHTETIRAEKADSNLMRTSAAVLQPSEPNSSAPLQSPSSNSSAEIAVNSLAEQVLSVSATQTSPVATSRTRWSWEVILVSSWIIGILVVGGISFGRVFASLRWISRQPHATNLSLDAEIQQLCVKLKVHRHVNSKVVDCLVGPFVFGFWRSTVVIPSMLVHDRSNNQLASLLAHELVHIRRGDLQYALLQMIVTTAFWFHPLVWLASAKLRQASELCCDLETIGELNCVPAEYARGLVSVLEKRNQLRVAAALPACDR